MTEPKVPVGLTNQPFYVRETKTWAVDQERYRHDQGLYSIGEPALFVLMWKVEDHKNGYVRRCPRCYGNNDPRLTDASAILNQPTKAKCPMCFGTTFEGGVRAKVLRPAIFTDADDQETLSEHGVNHPQTVSVESTSDFRIRNQDYVFRADGSRWRLATPAKVTVRTGFDHPSQADDAISYAPAMASLEDRSTVAWIIPPNEDDLRQLLQSSGRYPDSKLDEVNGPLIPKAYTD